MEYKIAKNVYTQESWSNNIEEAALKFAMDKLLKG